MALTDEQIKKLKPGDPLVVQGEFCQAYNNGNILVRLSVQRWETSIHEIRSFHPSCVSLPSEHGTSAQKPKYDPCRLFKGGDKVKSRTVDGRTDIDVVDNGVLTVTSDEDVYGNVRVKEPSGRSIVTKSVFLELVTPVEERKPYSVHEESMHNRWNVIKDKYVHGIHAMFPYKNISNSDLMSREEAKARADEYSDRLNAEWRKEQSND